MPAGRRTRPPICRRSRYRDAALPARVARTEPRQRSAWSRSWGPPDRLWVWPFRRGGSLDNECDGSAPRRGDARAALHRRSPVETGEARYGSEKTGLLYGYLFRPDQPGEPVEADEACDRLMQDGDAFVWLHFNLANQASIRWLR